jgi:hypothetical protein
MSTLDNPDFQTTPESKWPTALRWGLIIGLAGVALQLLWMTMGWLSFSSNLQASNILLQVISFALSVTLMSMGVRQYRDDHQDGYASFGQAFGTGMMIAIVISVITALFFALYMGDIMSEAMNEAIVQQFEESGMDDEEMEQAMEMTKMFSGPVFLTISGFFGSMFNGTLMALLAAVFGKRERPVSY